MSVSSWLTKFILPHFPSRRACRGRSARITKVTRRAPLWLEALENRLVPSTLTVTNSLDDGSSGTLRSTIAAAASGDTIVLSPILQGAPIVLAHGELVLNQNVTISAGDDVPETISGGGNSRVFEVAAGASVTLRHLTITGGDGVANNPAGNPFKNGSGGGILVDAGATLAVVDSILSGNTAVRGGGIENLGLATVIGSTLSGNSASYSGGGFENNGTLTVSDSTLSGNSAVQGGGIASLRLATVTGSILSSNSASFYGGGIYNEGTLTVSDSTVSGNSRGGIKNSFGTLTISDSTLSGNSGGGINNLGLATVTGSILSGNTARLGGGISNLYGSTLILRNDTLANNQAQGGGGGGLWNQFAATVTITGSTFVGNKAVGQPHFFGTVEGGGILNEGRATITNSAFTNNQALGLSGNFNGPNSNGIGGGIEDTGPMTVSGCTFTGNAAVGAAVVNGITQFSQGTGGAIAVGFTTATITNSIFTDNEAIGGAGGDGSLSDAAGKTHFVGDGGGIIAHFATLTVGSCTFTHNQAIGGAGGLGLAGSIGIGGGLETNHSTLTLIDSVFSHNVAQGGVGGSGAVGGDAAGGGLSIDLFSTATLSRLVLSYNLALGGNGIAGSNGGNAWGGGLSVGGGTIYNRVDGTFVTLANSVMDYNLAIGGDGGAGGNGSGGGAFLGINSSLGLTSDTIAKNHANGGGGQGGSTDGSGTGGGVYNLGVFAFDLATVIKTNNASTSNDDIFP